MERISKIDSSTLKAYWISGIIVCLIASLGAETLICRDYNSRMENASQKAQSYAQSLVGSMIQVFAKLDSLSLAISEDSTSRIVKVGLLSELMRRRAAAEPVAMGIAIIDRNGQITASSLSELTVGEDRRNTVNFRTLSQPYSPETLISRPAQRELRQNGVSDTRSFSYARKIKDLNGRFGGYVLIVVDETYFNGYGSTFYSQTDADVGMAGYDGIVFASNNDAAIGQNVSSFLPTEISDNLYRTSASVVNLEQRIYVYYRRSDTPVFAFVGLPKSPIYRAWLISSSVTMIALGCLFVSMVVLGILLSKYARSRASHVQTLIEITQERSERQFLEAIVDTGTVLMAVTDRIGNIIVSNRALRDLVYADCAESQFGTIATLLSEPFPRIIADLPWQKVVHRVTADGFEQALSWSVSAILASDGEIKNLVAMGLDITARRKAELAIYQSEKLLTLGEMATGIAHEINQPLATLTMEFGNLHAELSDGKLDREAVLTRLDSAWRQVDRATKIVQHMRIYSHRPDGSLRTLDPVKAIEGVLTIAGAHIQESGIIIRCSYEANRVSVLADFILLEQILLNLLLNARDAIIDGRGGHEDFIEIYVGPSEREMVEISVEDSGGGIAPANLERVFEPFFTTKPVGKGMGLGLSVSYGMAKEMGGRLEARNNARGAQFRLFLRRGEPLGENQ